MPNQITPNPGRFRRARCRSFAGPFVLILVGMVFLLGNLRLLSSVESGNWFAQLLACAADFLGRDQAGRTPAGAKDGARAPGIGAGGVCWWCMIVVSA